MAIYKNREVLVGRLTQSSTPEKQIAITYTSGETENVSLGQVRFTKKELEVLKKDYRNDFDDIEPISEDDEKAVRLGFAPSYDEAMQEAAEAKALAKKRDEEYQKQSEQRQKEAEKVVDKKVDGKTPFVNKPVV